MKNLIRTGKFLFPAVFYILFLSLSFSTTIFAENSSSTETHTIIALENSDYLSNLPPVEIIQNTQGDIEELYWFVFSLPTVNATVLHPDGSTDTMALSVSWDCTDYTKEHIDPSVLGIYSENGTIKLPGEDYTWGEGVLQTLTVPVHVIVPDEPILLTSLSSFQTTAFSLTQGEDLSEILVSIPSTISCYTENRKAYVADITWDAKAVDTQTPGVYSITGTLTAPMHCVFSETLQNTTFSIPVSVQAPGKPDINCFYIYYGYLLCFPWEMPEDYLESIQVWLKEDDGEWTLVSLDDYAEYSSDYFGLFLDCFTEGHSYKLQIDYEGGQTSIVSFDYSLDGELTLDSIVDGDRDGGDTNGNNNNNNNSDTPPNENTDTNPNGSDSDGSDSDDSRTPSNTNPKPNASDSEPSGSDTNTDPGSDKNTPPAPGTTTNSGSSTNTTTNTNKTANTGNGTNTSPNGNSGNGTNTNPNSNSGTGVNSNSNTGTSANTGTGAKANSGSGTDNGLSANAISAISAITDEQAAQEQNSDKQDNTSTDTATITGAELFLMLETSDVARFSCNGITLSCPAEALKALNISEKDTLEISIIPDDADGFTLNITLNGNPITKLSGMQIMIPFIAALDSPSLSLFDSEGNIVSEGTYDATRKLATFTIDHTGYFFIHDENTIENTSQNHRPVFLIVILFIGVVLLTCFVVYKRRTRA